MKLNNDNFEINYTGSNINILPAVGDVFIGSKLNVSDSPTSAFNPDLEGDIRYNSTTSDLEGFTPQSNSECLLIWTEIDLSLAHHLKQLPKER